jgi:hypothetical protein
MLHSASAAQRQLMQWLSVAVMGLLLLVVLVVGVLLLVLLGGLILLEVSEWPRVGV